MGPRILQGGFGVWGRGGGRSQGISFGGFTGFCPPTTAVDAGCRELGGWGCHSPMQGMSQHWVPSGVQVLWEGGHTERVSGFWGASHPSSPPSGSPRTDHRRHSPWDQLSPRRRSPPARGQSGGHSPSQHPRLCCCDAPQVLFPDMGVLGAGGGHGSHPRALPLSHPCVLCVSPGCFVPQPIPECHIPHWVPYPPLLRVPYSPRQVPYSPPGCHPLLWMP